MELLLGVVDELLGVVDEPHPVREEALFDVVERLPGVKGV